MSKLSEIVTTRKSVRTFDGTQIGPEHRKRIEEYIKNIANPFDIPVRFKLMDADEYGLSSPVLTGEKLYVAGITEKRPYFEVAYGYSFEKLVLYVWELGIGTVLIGGTMKRELFEAAAGIKEGELMPCVSPLGYPAKKRSLKESLMRKGVGADSRMPAEKLFFEGKWDQPLNPDRDMADVLEMVRLAPSAVNKQPWRIIKKDGAYHFYEKKDKGYDREKTGDLQKIDIGIALCHFLMGLEEKKIQTKVLMKDPGIATVGNAEYIASVCIG